MEFKALGKPGAAPSKELETFPAPSGVESVTFVSDELTSFCPVTAQPDFYRVEITYFPEAKCVESKSLKLYLQTFRDGAHFAEALASIIAKDISDATESPETWVKLRQQKRGGLELLVEATVSR